jgi:hypothetical protein
MSKPPKPSDAADGALLTPQLRAALLRELSPGVDQRKRVRAAVSSALAGAPMSLAVKQADVAMAGRAAQAKAGSAVAGKSLAAKLLISSVLLAGGVVVTGIALRHGSAPSDGSPALRSAPVAPAPLVRSESASVPPASTAMPPEPQPSAALARQPQPSAAAATELGEPALHPRPRRALATPRVSQHSQLSAATPARQPDTAAAPEPAKTPTPAAPSEAPANTDAPAAPSEAPVAVAAPRFSLGSELALVRAASAALDRRDAKAALKLVARHGAEYPNGALQTEAQALRALALCAAGWPEAEEARDAFVRAHPKSALADRVRSACQ